MPFRPGEEGGGGEVEVIDNRAFATHQEAGVVGVELLGVGGWMGEGEGI